MKRFGLAAALVAVLGLSAVAQPPMSPPPPAPSPAVPLPPPPTPTYSGPPGPAIPFHKSMGVVVGNGGYYPYDTGEWLLGGTDGATRQSGAFTMVYPGGNYAAVPSYSSGRRPLLGLFHKHK